MNYSNPWNGVEALRSQEEVADILGITRQAVTKAERRALAKLREHPVIRQLAVEEGVIGETEAIRAGGKT